MRRFLNNPLVLPVVMVVIFVLGVSLIIANPGTTIPTTSNQSDIPNYSGGIILSTGKKTSAQLNPAPASPNTAAVSQPGANQPPAVPENSSNLQATPCRGHRFGIQPSCARLYCPEATADGYALPCNGCGPYLDGGNEYACRMY